MKVTLFVFISLSWKKFFLNTLFTKYPRLTKEQTWRDYLPYLCKHYVWCNSLVFNWYYKEFMIICFMLWLFCLFLSWKISEKILAVLWIITSGQRKVHLCFLFNTSFYMTLKKAVRYSRIQQYQCTNHNQFHFTWIYSFILLIHYFI